MSRRFGLVLVVVCFGSMFFLSSVAGASWTPSSGPGTNDNGECNEQYDVSPLFDIFGYSVADSCEWDVPTAVVSNDLWVFPSIGYDYSSGDNLIQTAPFAGSLITANLQSGYTNCSSGHTLWVGWNGSSRSSGSYLYGCTSYVSPQAGLTTAPPTFFTSSVHMIGFFDMTQVTVGPTSGGYRAVTTRSIFTEPPDTYAAATNVYDDPSDQSTTAGIVSNFGDCSGNVGKYPGFTGNGVNGPYNSTPGASGWYGSGIPFTSSPTVLLDAPGATADETIPTSSWYPDASLGGVTCSTSVYSYPAFPNMIWTGGTTTLVDSPCTIGAVTGDSSANPSSSSTASYAYTVTFSGAVQTIVVDPSDGSTPTQTIHGQTFSADAEFDDVPPDSSPVAFSVNVVAGQVVDPHLWCYDAGIWYDWGVVADNQLTTLAGVAGTPSQFSLCLNSASSSITWYQPWTYIVPALKVGQCMLQELFVPQVCGSSGAGNVCINTSSFTHQADSTVPFSYIAGAMTDVDAFVGAANVTASCTAPSIAFPSFASGFFHKVNSSQFSVTLPVPTSCGASYALPGEGAYNASNYVGELFGFRVFLRDVMSFIVWLTFIAIAWRMMPWSRSGDGISVLTGYTAEHSAMDIGGDGITQGDIDDVERESGGVDW